MLPPTADLSSRKFQSLNTSYTARLAVYLEIGLEVDNFELVTDLLLLVFSASAKKNNVTKQ